MGRPATASLQALALAALWTGSVMACAPPQGPQAEASDDEAGSEADTGDDTGDDGGEGQPEDEPLPPLGERPEDHDCRLEGRPAEALPGLRARVPEPWTALGTSFPAAVQILPAPGEQLVPSLLVVEADGAIWQARPEHPSLADVPPTKVLDLGPRVAAPSPDLPQRRGLMAAAVAPDATAVFVHYQRANSPQRTRVARYPLELQANGDLDIDVNAELVVLDIDHEGWLALGGGLSFDADGMLLIGTGDDAAAAPTSPESSPATDPLDPRGAVLRVDVSAPGSGYAVPADNPFAGSDAGADEVYAVGLHDPRLCFAGPAGASWCVDRGSGLRDELNRVEAGRDYGWPRVEGYLCTGSGGECDPALTLGPHADYGFDDFEPTISHCELRGGLVYAGASLGADALGLDPGQGLDGAVLFGDRCSGRIWGLRPEVGPGAFEVVGWLESDTPNAAGVGVLALGADSAGEPWLIDSAGGLAQLTLDPHGVPGSLPTTLSTTSCFAPDFSPDPELVPFQVASALWSDGLSKRRYLVLPPDERIEAFPDGRWSFPEGSVLIKTFSADDGDAPVETRFMVRRNGVWTFYSYRWREDLSDADLLAGGDTRDLGSFEWAFPARADCQTCHGFASGRPLGPTTVQMNRAVRYGDRSESVEAQQLDALVEAGYLAFADGFVETQQGESVAPQLPALPDFRDTDLPVDVRARAYMHANCSHCHHPEWMRPDLRYPTSLADTGVCEPSEFPNPWTDEGSPALPRVAPGDPEGSILWLRTGTRDEGKMPALGSALVDPTGHALLGAWIESLSTCP
ncbi:hypothetical protein PPSIR1_00560 [Plesiocystis pacifica SIR-1]|uniref:Glucose/Sorbosone dehydrogenase domain-containing protein n=1 Tax=Plesiocystis pacifica SIR-1 TaxID=391625 RepID=A6G7H0_9BACT|nr:PQQ-dependent sugar dehydrogenase [Plesiocystis pacifica]EDM78179.1 hypothetical protein PPSIR1_00560 [Plesiocystis pacifica SIR-1]